MVREPWPAPAVPRKSTVKPYEKNRISPTSAATEGKMMAISNDVAPRSWRRWTRRKLWRDVMRTSVGGRGAPATGAPLRTAPSSAGRLVQLVAGVVERRRDAAHQERHRPDDDAGQGRRDDGVLQGGRGRLVGGEVLHVSLQGREHGGSILSSVALMGSPSGAISVRYGGAGGAVRSRAPAG